jgi:hypothetical protein
MATPIHTAEVDLFEQRHGLLRAAVAQRARALAPSALEIARLAMEGGACRRRLQHGATMPAAGVGSRRPLES